MRAYHHEIAGFEPVEVADSRIVCYDVNTNTNYNPDVEQVAPKSGPGEIATYLQRIASTVYAPV